MLQTKPTRYQDDISNNILKRKLKVKQWSQIKILIIGKHSSDGRIYLVANTKIKICKFEILGVMQ